MIQALVSRSERYKPITDYTDESLRQSVRPILFLGEPIAEVHPPSKSNPGHKYTTAAFKDGDTIRYTCDCKGRQINLKCWHIRDLAKLVEGAELFKEKEINPYQHVSDLITNARNSNSMIAWSSLQGYLGDAQKAVFEAIRAFPGITRQDVCPKVRMPINSVSGRVNDLIKMGLVVEGESVKNSKTGMPNATLWAISEVEQ